MRRVLVVGLMIGLIFGAASMREAKAQSPAQSTVLTSPSTRVALLELYTSEGCSSCPPADRWISKLRDDPRLWREVVPVAFHVDYWDYIGWKDEFADPRFSARQRRFAREQRLRSVYTPGLVVAGKEWRGWFRRPVLELDAAPEVGRLHLEVHDQTLAVRFEPAGEERGEFETHVALLGFGLRTAVQAGENAGRTLEHDFVVLGYESATMARRESDYHIRLPRPGTQHPAERIALAAWVNARGDQRPVQAVGGWLVQSRPKKP